MRLLIVRDGLHRPDRLAAELAGAGIEALPVRASELAERLAVTPAPDAVLVDVAAARKDAAALLRLLSRMTPPVEACIAAGERTLAAAADLARRHSGRVLRKPLQAADLAALLQTPSPAGSLRQLLQDAVESLGNAVLIFDREDRLVFANRWAKRDFPEAPELFTVGMPYEAALRQAVRRGLFEAACGREEAFIAERLARHRQADGTPMLRPLGDRILQVREHRIRDGGTVLIASDVTHGWRAGEAAAERDEWMRLATDHLPVLLAYCDRDETVRFINRTGAVWWGRRPEEAIGATLAEINGEQYGAIKFEIDRALTGETISYERLHSYGDGSRRYIETTLIPHRDRHGTVQGFFALTQDRTDLTVAARRLQERNQLIESVLSGIDQGLTAFDHDLRLTLWNAKAREIMGYPPDLLRPGTPYRELVAFSVERGHYGEAADTATVERMVAAAREARASRVERRTADGRMIDVRRSPLPDGSFVNTLTDVSEARRIEEALRQSEQRFRAIAQLTPVPSAIVRLSDRRTLYANNEASRQVGREAAEAAVLEVHASIGEGFRDRELQVAAAGGQLWLLASAQPITFDGSDCLFVSWLDITASRRAREALERSEAKLAEAQRIAGVGSWEHDLAGDEIEWSSFYFDLLGLDRTATVPSYDLILSLTHPDDRAGMNAYFAAAMREGDGGSHEYRVVRPDGAVRNVRSVFHIDRDARGRAVRVAGTTQDVTDLRAAQAALEQSESRFRAVLNQSPMAFVLTDPTGHITLINQTFERWFGTTSEGTAGRRLRDLAPPDIAERIRWLHEVAHVAEEPLEIEIEIGLADGKPHVLWLTAFLIRNGDGSVAGIGNIGVDITAERQAEERLRHSQKLEAIGQMTGGVAHDFNNLLTAIIGNLDLLAARLGEDPQSQQLLQTATRAAERGGRLTQQLLAFSRRQVLAPQRLDLNEVVEGFLPLAGTTVRADIAVVTSLARGLWPALVDRGQLESALLNLVINARDAIPGSGQIMIETGNRRLSAEYAAMREEVTPGDYVMVAVSDNGVGMSAAERERAVDPFFTTKPVGQGSGLGLSMVFGFVKQSGGHMSIYSEPNIGTTVRLFLPTPVTLEAVEAEHPATVSGTPRGDETVLVVEDDADVRRFVTAGLERLGYRVLTASDGPSAIEAMERASTVDLLLTDVVLPGVSGRIVAAAFRERFPEGRVLYTSGYPHEMLSSGGRLEPGLDLLGKPYRIDALAQRVRAVLDG